MKSTPQRIWKRSERLLYQAFKTRAVLARMSRSEDERVRALAAVIQGSFNGELSADDRERIDGIRALRRELAASTEPLDGSTVGIICEGDSRPHSWLLLLFNLVRQFKPQRSVELGTCIGLSAAYQFAAMALNGKGSLVTMELSEARVAQARENFFALGMDEIRVVPGRFSDTLEQVLKTEAQVDFAFIDGHHDEFATVNYYEQMLPYLSKNAVVVFDDIQWSEGMQRAWARILALPDLAVTVDLFKVGIVIHGDGSQARQSFKLALD